MKSLYATCAEYCTTVQILHYKLILSNPLHSILLHAVKYLIMQLRGVCIALSIVVVKISRASRESVAGRRVQNSSD